MSQSRHAEQVPKGKKRVDDVDIKLSKKLSWLLRHGAEKAGIKLDAKGFVDVSRILQIEEFKGYRLADIERVVEKNDKKRFSLERNPETQNLQIRANQGHSLQVDELKLTPITSAEEAPRVIHGTYWKAWKFIESQGLSRMNRNHIHFASAEPDEEESVTSGIRKNCEIFIYVDLESALKDGLLFFRSENGVILSPGDERGFIAPKYFKDVIQKSPRKVIQKQ